MTKPTAKLGYLRLMGMLIILLITVTATAASGKRYVGSRVCEEDLDDVIAEVTIDICTSCHTPDRVKDTSANIYIFGFDRQVAVTTHPEARGQLIDQVDETVAVIAAAAEEPSASTKQIAENISHATTGMRDVNQNVADSSEPIGICFS